MIMQSGLLKGRPSFFCTELRSELSRFAAHGLRMSRGVYITYSIDIKKSCIFPDDVL